MTSDAMFPRKVHPLGHRHPSCARQTYFTHDSVHSKYKHKCGTFVAFFLDNLFFRRQVALTGLIIAATAANTRPTGAKAFAARAVVTLAVALVASEALRQVQQLPQAAAPPPAGAGAEGGMASLLALVSGAGAKGDAPGCENPTTAGADAGEGGEGEGVGGGACLKVGQSALLAWDGFRGGGGVACCCTYVRTPTCCV